MINVFIIAHAPLASALRVAALHAYPELANSVASYDVPAGNDVTLYEAQAEALLSQLTGEGVLVITDALGATPANLAGKLAQQPKRRALSGASLPMVWRALNYRKCTLDEVFIRARDGAMAGVQSVNIPAPQHQPPHTGPHDPQRSHHQQ